MGFKCGIVGLPNVGKSTLFNALTNSSKAQAENFPFCTIDPNIGIVPVPDHRLDRLSEISKSKKKINTSIAFVDIAGLVKGASKGEGLGNKFLSHIREVDAIIHMIRCFDSADIQKQLPQESKRFTTVDKYWRTTMAAAIKQVKAVKFCDDIRLLERFKEGNKLLEMVQIF